ncbi:MAG: DUF192 domain-containing protein [Bacteroidetes bacterium]|nr:DUF192 domain-containing protein [Bacteroidota bacterium]
MRIVLLTGLLLLMVAACENDSPSNSQTDAAFRKDGTLEFVRSDGSVIRSIEIEIAEDEATRQTGLMNRRQMTLAQGMLFLFSDEAPRKFWMANTPIPLDIMFVGADSQIVNIARRTRPLSRENVVSTGPAQYVVEVRGGFSDRFGLDETIKIRWQRSE